MPRGPLASTACYFNLIVGPAFKLKYLTTSTSSNLLFLATQLQDLTMILPNNFDPGTPCRLDNDNPLNPAQNLIDDDNDLTITQESQGDTSLTAATTPTPLPRD
jgi:hypothetical protein